MAPLLRELLPLLLPPSGGRALLTTPWRAPRERTCRQMMWGTAQAPCRKQELQLMLHRGMTDRCVSNYG
mgnify:CR=1 FL=1